VINAHPSKSGGDWWYGTPSVGGKTGFFPRTYVQTFENGMFTFSVVSLDFLTCLNGPSQGGRSLFIHP
jgi:hypothetical protein